MYHRKNSKTLIYNKRGETPFASISPQYYHNVTTVNYLLFALYLMCF